MTETRDYRNSNLDIPRPKLPKFQNVDTDLDIQKSRYPPTEIQNLDISNLEIFKISIHIEIPGSAISRSRDYPRSLDFRYRPDSGPRPRGRADSVHCRAALVPSRVHATVLAWAAGLSERFAPFSKPLVPSAKPVHKMDPLPSPQAPCFDQPELTFPTKKY